MTDQISFFESRIRYFQEKENAISKKVEKWSWIRGITFILAAFATYFSANNYNIFISLFVFIVSFAAFLYTVSTHLKLVAERTKLTIFSKLNQQEINRLHNELEGHDGGNEFIEKSHYYASDLDLFGKHSLFQILNRCHTFAGKLLLSQWMKTPAAKNEILERQLSAAELCKEIDFRQTLEVTALLGGKVGEPVTMLLEWIQTAENQKVEKPIFKYGIYLPALTFIVLIGAIFGLYTYYFVLLCLLFQGIILKLVDEDIDLALTQTEKASEPLKSYADMMQLIVNKQFSTNKLQQLQAKITAAPAAVYSLQKTTHFLSYRSNPVAAFGGIIFMNDLRNFIKLEKWRSLYKQDLAIWLAVVSEFEALNSLASFQFANPHYSKPVISENSIELITSELSHPLIHSAKRVPNNFAMEGVGKTTILTGSNMSGKSTFERTVGINLVLALMGAVVAAQKFECTIMQLFTGMRTQDSLENDTSSFYAELKRLEQLIQLTKAVENSLPVFYLLDEILKGTNSKDRHSGATALILQLKERNSSGIISTHDVELGDEFEGETFIKNYSFSSEMVDNELVFDYKLKAGVCHSFNASELMRRIGIEITTDSANK